MYNKKINFSVLITVYLGDALEAFRAAIESILNQTLMPSEILIVVDGPLGADIRNYLVELEIKQNIVKVHHIEENVGLAKALNIGLDLCINEIVARMDSDDIARPERFEKTIPIIMEDSSISLIGGQHEIYNDDMSRCEGVRVVPTNIGDIKRYSRFRTPINHPTIAFRKSSVKKIGGYPEDVGRFEDWGLCLSLLKNDFSIVNVADFVLKVRGGGGMMSRRSGLTYLKEEVRALKRMRHLGLLSLSQYILNLCIRCPIRLIPSSKVKYFYRYFLRR